MLSTTADSPRPDTAGTARRALPVLMIVIFLAGTALRLFAPPDFKPMGHDETLYTSYVDFFAKESIFNYPEVVQNYAATSHKRAELPPTRFLYIFLACCWRSLTGQASMDSLHAISCLFSILTMPLAAYFAYRLGGAWMGTGVLALVACSPMQIYFSRHALIDGFFAFWGLLSVCLLWENLRRPARPVWLAAYGAGIALMVLTKENAFFVFVAILGILAVNRWMKFGTVTRPLLLCTFGGAFAGAAGVALISGGFDHAIQACLRFVHEVSHLDYAMQTGDGPWYRYLCELLLLSPFVLLLAIGAVFGLARAPANRWFLFCFVAFSYAIMCNVRYGMNLRYTIIWDMPLRYLALWQLAAFCSRFGSRKNAMLAGLVTLLCIFDLCQYHLFFVVHEIYEPIPHAIFRAEKFFIPSP